MKTKTLVIIVLAVLILLLVLVKVSILRDLQSASILSEKEAIDVMLIQYPQLAVYQNTDLPPSSIESTQSEDGWYLGFIRRGSGVPGILDAKCYYVNNDKTITSVGEYIQGNSGAVDIINLETCESDVEVPAIIPVLPDTDEPVVTEPVVTEPVVTEPVVTDPVVGACYKGGCSSQLCTDQPDMASTCEYREEYACYQSAVCERQQSGQCGWTETSDLRACLTTQSR